MPRNRRLKILYHTKNQRWTYEKRQSYTAVGLIHFFPPNHTLAPKIKSTIAYKVFNLCFEIFSSGKISQIEIYHSKF